jgi:hypothetical protein
VRSSAQEDVHDLTDICLHAADIRFHAGGVGEKMQVEHVHSRIDSYAVDSDLTA